MQDSLRPRQAALELGLHVQNLYALLWSGRLRGTQDPTGRWLVSRRDLEEFMKRREAVRRKKITGNRKRVRSRGAFSVSA